MPAVSVIIPTHNRADAVTRAIASATRQTFTDIEIVIVDDGSTDNTDGRLAHLAGQAGLAGTKFRVLRRATRGGANAARNMAIREVRGKFIAFLDSDDIWHPEKLSRQVCCAGASGTRDVPKLSYTGRFRLDEHGRVIARQMPGLRADPTRIRCGNFIGPLSSVLIDTKVAQEIGGFDEELPASQDWDFFVRATPRCALVPIREPLLMYYDGDGDDERISRSDSRRLIGSLKMHQKHDLRSLPPRDRAELYRNLAEALEGVGKRSWAARFYARSLMLQGERFAASTICIGLREPSIRAARYERYFRALRRRHAVPRYLAEDTRYLAAYEESLCEPLDWIWRAAKQR